MKDHNKLNENLTDEIDKDLSYKIIKNLTSKIKKMNNPVKYSHGEIVSFYDGEKLKKGEIIIIDAFGTFEQNEEPSYDIFIKEENCLYKHVRQSQII